MMTTGPVRHIFNGITNRELEQFDLDAINGKNADIPRFKEHTSVLALCRHFVGVFRKRVDPKSLEVAKDENGEDIWIVGELGEMHLSEMLELAAEYDRLPGRFKL